MRKRSRRRRANGQTVELDLFPLHSQVFTGAAKCAPSTDPQACGDTARIQSFAAWTAAVARAFPAVHQFVVMNECNQPLFVNPQFDQSGANQSAEICGRALAASYDALKAVSAANFVWGVGLSPRGNDNPTAASNVSTSPTAFLRDLGAWFKAFAVATGRTKPLMDGLDFHPYPIPQSLPFATGYANTTSATVSNLPRIYQAFYDGFNGTPQPTIGQQPGGGLPLSLNEVGIQTDSTGHPGYVGTETAADAAGGVFGATATEAYQASWYGQMLALVACDPNVRVVDLYHLLDEASLAGWQSGLYYVDHTAKQSAATVHDWIASTGGACQGAPHPWTPPGVAAAPAPPPAPVPHDRVSRHCRLGRPHPRVRRRDPCAPPRVGALRRLLHGPDRARDGRCQPRRRRRLRSRRPVGRNPERQDRRAAGFVPRHGDRRRARRRQRRRPGGPPHRRRRPGEGLRREDAPPARDC